MIETWRQTEAKFEPHYSVANLRDETVYSLPLASGHAGGRMDIRFRFLNRDAAGKAPPESYRDIEVEYVLELFDEAGTLRTSIVLEKDDVQTLQKLLSNVLEHSTVRRFQWFAEVLSEAELATAPLRRNELKSYVSQPGSGQGAHPSPN